MVIVAHEDAAAIAVESDGDAEAAQQALEQAKIAFGGFGGEELGGEDFAGGIVRQTQNGQVWATTFEPVVRGAIELQEFTIASDTRAPRRGDRVVNQQHPLKIAKRHSPRSTLPTRGVVSYSSYSAWFFG